MSTRNLFMILAVLVIVGGAAWLLAGQKQSNTTMQPSTTTTTTTTTAASPTALPSTSPSASPSGAMEDETAVKEFTIDGSNFKFQPNTIAVNKGDKVKVTFKNTQGFHDFVIDEYNVRTKQINGGAEDMVEFTADKAGTFEFYCSVGQHRQMGMKGTLTVK